MAITKCKASGSIDSWNVQFRSVLCTLHNGERGAEAGLLSWPHAAKAHFDGPGVPDANGEHVQFARLRRWPGEHQLPLSTQNPRRNRNTVLVQKFYSYNNSATRLLYCILYLTVLVRKSTSFVKWCREMRRVSPSCLNTSLKLSSAQTARCYNGRLSTGQRIPVRYLHICARCSIALSATRRHPVTWTHTSKFKIILIELDGRMMLFPIILDMDYSFSDKTSYSLYNLCCAFHTNGIIDN